MMDDERRMPFFCTTLRSKNHPPRPPRRSPLHPSTTAHPSKPDRHGKSSTNQHDGREHPRASPPPPQPPYPPSRLPNRASPLGPSGDVRVPLSRFADALIARSESFCYAAAACGPCACFAATDDPRCASWSLWCVLCVWCRLRCPH